LNSLFLSCSKAPEGNGTIVFTANGEDFVVRVLHQRMAGR
jgi:hypothetical protein